MKAVQPGVATDSLRAVKDGDRLVTVSGDLVSPERGVHVEVVPLDTDVRDELTRSMAEIARGEK